MKSSELKQKIVEYIKTPQYQDIINHAIVIKGKWGSGKTYFIKKLLKEEFDNNIYQVYISLYGLSEISELENAVKSAFIPLIDNKYIKIVKDNNSLACDLLNTLDKKKFSSETLLLSKEMISFLWRIGIDATKLYKKKNKKRIVFIVDDLERCNIHLNKVFGYFSNILNSNYIIFDKTNHIKQNFNKNRIIFILNPDELNTNLKIYNDTKEKLIGIEYELEPEINIVLKDYEYHITEKNNKLSADIINNSIQNVCEKISYFNLRMIKYTQQYINKILDELQKDDKSIDKKYVENFVTYLTLIMIQKVQGKIKNKEDIYNFVKTFCLSGKLFSKEETNNKYEQFNSKWIALYDLLYDIVLNGTFDKEKIQEDYDTWKLINIDTTSFNYLCSNYEYMDETSFKELYKKFDNDFNTNQMLKMADLFDFYQLKYELIEKKIISQTITELDTLFTTYFKKNENNLIYENFNLEYDDAMQIKIEYCEKHNNSSLPKLMNEMIKMSMQHYDSNYYFDTFVNDYKEKKLKKMIDYIESVDLEYEYFIVPILSKLNIDEFFSYLIKFNTKEQLEIFDAFQKRYNRIIHINNNNHSSTLINTYIDDKESLQKLSELYNDSKYSTYLNPENYMKKQLSLKYNSLCNLQYE